MYCLRFALFDEVGERGQGGDVHRLVYFDMWIAYAEAANLVSRLVHCRLMDLGGQLFSRYFALG